MGAGRGGGGEVYGDLESGNCHYQTENIYFCSLLKYHFWSFNKNKKQKILKANKVSSLVCKSLRGCYIKFKTLQPHLHLTRNGKLNVTTLFILKSDGLFAASQS